MSRSIPNRRLVVGGALALAGAASAGVAAARNAKPALTVTEAGGAGWRAAQFEAFRRRYIDGGKVLYVTRKDGAGFLLSRSGQTHATVTRSGELTAAVEAALAA